jgi:NADPH:quinone reductase-like Zn-dependent oxidoreductase
MLAAIREGYAGPEAVALRDVERPAVGDEDVLVEVRAAGLDPGVWHLATGLPYVVRLAGYGIRKPKIQILGADLAGRVEAVGRHVTRFQPGDHVFGRCEGSFAEYACTHQDRLAPKPRSLSFEKAAALPVSGSTALQAIRDAAKVQPGESVLVIGAGGGVGTFAIQIAKARGARVTGVCSSSKTALVRDLGVDEVIDYTRQDLTAHPRRYDVVLDTAGNRALRQLRSLLTSRGRLVLIGGESKGRWLGGTGRLLRALLSSPLVTQQIKPHLTAERSQDLHELQSLVEAGLLRPIIGTSYSLTEVSDAIADLERKHAHGKAVLVVLHRPVPASGGTAH